MKKWILLSCIFVWVHSLSAQQKFDAAEISIIQQASPNGILRILQTTNLQDSLHLRREAVPIDVQDKHLTRLTDLLLKTVNDPENEGVGIAASQVGINKQIFLLQRFDKDNQPFEVVLNPQIIWTSNLIQNGREGCLSIPDTMGMVDRFYAVQVKYQNLKGEWITELLEGFTAIIFQHEYDHLVGVLFLDRLTEQAQKQYVAPKTPLRYLSDKNTR